MTLKYLQLSLASFIATENRKNMLKDSPYKRNILYHAIVRLLYFKQNVLR